MSQRSARVEVPVSAESRGVAPCSAEPMPRQTAAPHGSARRILALATNPETGASTRCRVLQWAPALEAAGFSLSLDAFFSPAGAEVLYQPGRYGTKAAHVIFGAVRRAARLARAPRTADLLFIHREAFPLGRRFFLKTLERFPGPIVYDYDDAMFLPQRGGRGLLARFEDVETPKEVMRLSRVVLAGNEFLAEYARPYAGRVVVLPTCIDTQRFVPRARQRRPGEPLLVGWIGSHSTAKYLHSLKPVLEEAAREIPFRLYIVGSAEPLALKGIEVTQAAWSLAREVDDFSRCDVGVYPVWPDAWGEGKCGYKAIQFMACGVPVVASAVGVNRTIIEEGVTGSLASTEEEWVDKLKQLLLDAALRQRLGQAGREAIEARYSLDAHAATLLSAFDEAIKGP